MGNCCSGANSPFVRGGKIKKSDDDKTVLDFRKEFRGSIVDLEYFHSKEPVKRRSLIKPIRKDEKLELRKSESAKERNLVISLS